MARPDTRAVVSAEVERAITTQLPDVEVVDVQLAPGGLLRVLIDHPKGVDAPRPVDPITRRSKRPFDDRCE